MCLLEQFLYKVFYTLVLLHASPRNVIEEVYQLNVDLKYTDLYFGVKIMQSHGLIKQDLSGPQEWV